MPGFDGTGPMGTGPMTGGGRGYCSMPLNDPSANFDMGGYGFYGRGRGRGHRNRFYRRGGFWGCRAISPDGQAYSEVDMLKNEADYLREELELIQRRIKELDSCKKN